MNISIRQNILTIGTEKVEFPYKISHVEKFDKTFIILTDHYESTINENVWGVDENGRKIWQIQKVDHTYFKGKQYLGIASPYTGIHKVNEGIARLFYWDGGYIEVNPATGKLTKNIIESRQGKRPW